MASKEVQPIHIEPVYFKLHLKVLLYLGINIIPIKNPTFLIAFYIYSTLLISTMVTYTVLEFLDMIINYEGLDKMTFLLCYFVTHILGTAKMFLMIIFRNKFWNLLEKMERDIFKPNMQRGGIEEFKLIQEAIKLCNRQGIIFYTLVILIISARAIFAALANLPNKDYFDNELNITVVNKKIMPYNTWMPFDFNQSPRYEIIFAFQIFSTVVYGYYIGAVDAVICGFMMLIKAQFLILKRALDTLIERAEKAAVVENKNQNEPVSRVINDLHIPEETEKIELLNKKAQEYAEKFANECVYLHQQLLIFCDQAENDFCYLMLLQFMSSLLIVCFQLYQVSTSPIGSPEFVSMTMYLILMLYQLLCYCWHGNEVAVVSGEISAYAYNINWLVANNAVRKTLLLIMMRSQRPCYFTAGKFSLLSLETFMTIVRGAGSYFMFLKQMSA